MHNNCKKFKYLRTNLTKDWYDENFKTSKKEIKDSKTGKNLFLLIGIIISINISILPRAIYRFEAITIKIPTTCLRSKKNYAEVEMERQETLNSWTNTKQQNQSWRNHNTRPQDILQGSGNQDSLAGTIDMKTKGTEWNPRS